MFKRTHFLVIVPLVLLITGLLYIHNSGLYFLRSVDPEYGYLLNGTLLAYFKPDIWFITNPGIPVHLLVATVSPLIHLFRPGQPLMEDVMTNPELYIRSALYAVNIMNALVLFIVGFFAYRVSKNFAVAFLLQLMPFTNLLTLEATARLMPEAMMLIISSAWVITIISLFYNKNIHINYKKYSIIFGLLFAWGISDKLSYLPYVILPIIILPDWKNRLRFLASSGLFFVFLGFPVILNHKFFTDWAYNIISHTGPYGMGQRGIVNPVEFYAHLKLLINNNWLLIASAGVLMVLTFIILYKRKIRHENTLIIRISIAIVLTIILQFIIASKHFAYHYMIPAILLTPLIIVIAGSLIQTIFPTAKPRFGTILFSLVAVALIILIVPRVNRQLREIESASQVKISAYNHLSAALKPGPKIIVPSYYGCSSIEYALTYGIHVSGKYGGFLYEKVKKLYPFTFMFFPWDGNFYEGNKIARSKEFIRPETVYHVYIADYYLSKRDRLLDSLRISGKKPFLIPVDSVRETNEKVFLLKFADKPDGKPE